MKEAMFYQKLKDGVVQCQLCPHFCTIKLGERGRCGVRENVAGKLYSLVYNRLATYAVDPVEKKPLFHFYPGEDAFSISTVGCNFSCLFCQNYALSQSPKPDKEVYGELVTANEVVSMAMAKNCSIISYTYSEPTIAFEYYYEIMRLAKSKGLRNTFVTNGFINSQPLKKLANFLDAANVDLKSFSEEFYQNIVGGSLKPVLDAIKLYHKLGIWVEVTTLVIPGKNDSEEELYKIAEFIAGVDANIPWHISRFFPYYKMQDVEPTPVETLLKAAELGKKAGLRYIYVGNVPLGSKYESTFCWKCGEIVIARQGFYAQSHLKQGGVCPKCGAKIAGRF
ncbi:AmmeMemoRadiSam system radical SAM enzyme [Candidatus Woesearchaeota archaeon]|nr:MAG: AmmeMemoRadiSam system radical SAM enzyme [Candidatus Woesearchaeota archaeon]